MTDIIEMVFGAGGLLAQRRENYEERPGQIAMARSVDEAILCDRKIAIEAPTGTGKSIAYLVPAIAHAVETGRKVIVATANIALQEQLLEHDLPSLREALPWEFSFALAKGKSNYACLHEASELDEYEDWQADEVQAVQDWLAETRTGDWSEIHWELNPLVKRLFVVDHDECPGKSRCKQGARCWAELARDRVRQATVVVTNYHLLMAHLSLQAKIGRGNSKLLPDLDIVVLDECQKMCDIARDFFGLRITESAVRRLARFLPMPEGDRATRGRNAAFKAELAARAGQVFAEVGRLAPAHQPRLRGPLPIDLSRVNESLGQLAAAYTAQAAVQAEEDGPEAYYRDEFGELSRKGNAWDHRAQRCRDAVATLATLVLGDLDDGLVRFIGSTDRGRPTLEAKLVDVGPELNQQLFSCCRSVVMTSATLAVDNSFDYFARDAGLIDYDSLVVPTPFDFRRQCALVICPSAPEPDELEFGAFMCQKLEEIVRAAGGRTLGLFTSYRNLDRAHEFLAARKLPFKLLRQGQGERSRLLDEFKRDRASVLLGTDSFWAGVDVQGESLSVVVIDKLPFPRMNDPVLSVLSERDPKRSFRKDSVPRAVIQFKQGFGRLIRTAADCGVVVLLDPRIVTRRYGRQFISSLPPVEVTEDCIAAIENKLGRQPTQLSL